MQKIFKLFFFLSLVAIQPKLNAASQAHEDILYEGNIDFVKKEVSSQKELSETIKIKISGSEDVVSSFEDLVIYGEDISFDSSRFLIFVNGMTKIEKDVNSLVFSKPRCVVIDTLRCSIVYCSEMNQSIGTPPIKTLKDIDLCEK